MKRCEVCRCWFDPRARNGRARAKKQRACSLKCAGVLGARTRGELPAVDTPPKVCPACHAEFRRRIGENMGRWNARRTCGASACIVACKMRWKPEAPAASPAPQAPRDGQQPLETIDYLSPRALAYLTCSATPAEVALALEGKTPEVVKHARLMGVRV